MGMQIITFFVIVMVAVAGKYTSDKLFEHLEYHEELEKLNKGDING